MRTNKNSGDCTTVATQPRQLHYSDNLSKKKKKNFTISSPTSMPKIKKGGTSVGDEVLLKVFNLRKDLAVCQKLGAVFTEHGGRVLERHAKVMCGVNVILAFRKPCTCKIKKKVRTLCGNCKQIAKEVRKAVHDEKEEGGRSVGVEGHSITDKWKDAAQVRHNSRLLMITAYLTNAKDGTPASEPDKDTLQAMGEAISRRIGGVRNPESCLQTYTYESRMNPPTAQVEFMMQFSNPHKAFTEHQMQRFDGTKMKQGSLIMHCHTGQQYNTREHYKKKNPPANHCMPEPSPKPPIPNQPCPHTESLQSDLHTRQQYTNEENTSCSETPSKAVHDEKEEGGRSVGVEGHSITDKWDDAAQVRHNSRLLMITAYLTNAKDGTPASEPDKDTLQAMGKAISRRIGGVRNPESCLQTYTYESRVNPPTAQVEFMMQFSNPHKAFTEHQMQRFDGTKMKQGSLIMHCHTGQQYNTREHYKKKNPPANHCMPEPSPKPPIPNQPCPHTESLQSDLHTRQQYTNGENTSCSETPSNGDLQMAAQDMDVQDSQIAVDIATRPPQDTELVSAASTSGPATPIYGGSFIQVCCYPTTPLPLWPQRCFLCVIRNLSGCTSDLETHFAKEGQAREAEGHLTHFSLILSARPRGLCVVCFPCQCQVHATSALPRICTLRNLTHHRTTVGPATSPILGYRRLQQSVPPLREGYPTRSHLIMVLAFEMPVVWDVERWDGTLHCKVPSHFSKLSSGWLASDVGQSGVPYQQLPFHTRFLRHHRKASTR